MNSRQFKNKSKKKKLTTSYVFEKPISTENWKKKSIYPNRIENSSKWAEKWEIIKKYHIIKTTSEEI